jgi:hypothetical protein
LKKVLVISLFVPILNKAKLGYSQTCVQWPPLGPEKSGRLIEVPDKTEIVDGSNWSLLTGGRYSQVAVKSGLTVYQNCLLQTPR